MRSIFFFVCAWLLVLPAVGQNSTPYTGNPIVPGNFADPCLLQYRDTFYLYATTGTEATVWRSADFKNWRLTKLAWPTAMKKPDIWAPAVRQGRDGRFYFYTSTDHNIYAGVAVHPLGPFRNMLGDDSIFIRNRQGWDKLHSIDADCFIDDDGQAYLYWGSGFDFKDGICIAGKLGPDMASFAEPPTDVTPAGYFEGPHMLKRNGLYYLMYSDGLYYDSTYKVRYATGTGPMGPFVQGKNSPVLQSTPDGRVSGPGHHYTFQHGQDYYIVYHRHVYPYYEGVRQVCVDRMNFDADGAIQPIIPTEQGVPIVFAAASKTKTELVPLRATASGAMGAVYSAEKAFDQNNGTLWAAPAKAAAWLMADMGRQVPIQSVSPVFDRVMGRYEYRIETSADAKKWQPFASGNNASATEWPVEHRRAATARYVRITITASEAKDRIGLWELRMK